MTETVLREVLWDSSGLLDMNRVGKLSIHYNRHSNIPHMYTFFTDILTNHKQTSPHSPYPEMNSYQDAAMKSVHETPSLRLT